MYQEHEPLDPMMRNYERARLERWKHEPRMPFWVLVLGVALVVVAVKLLG